jgi:ParB family chromosome partitioning protein
MINNQLGRRNLTRETASYLRGLQYEREKKKVTDTLKQNTPLPQNDGTGETAKRLANQHNVSKATIERDAVFAKAVDTITKNTTPEVKQKILNREIEISKKETEQIAKLEPEKQKEIIEKAIEKNIPIREININNPHVSNNSGNNEWYTPAEIIESARVVLGNIDLDPASCEIANKVVKADKIFTIDDNGLEQEWYGNVWLNPPYASELIGLFCDKLVESNLNQAIVLVNNATETQWFSTLINKASAVIFPKGRVKFYMPDGKTGAPLQGQAIIYIGSNPEEFLQEFKKFGWGACL